MNAQVTPISCTLFLLFVCFFTPTNVQAVTPQEAQSTTESPPLFYTRVLDPDSPVFLLGQETGPNIHITAQDNPDMSFQLGIRVQGSAEYQSRSTAGASDDNLVDFYGRRVRLEVGATFAKNLTFIMDLRNDRVNQEDSGNREFEVGDAKLTWKNIFDNSLLNAAAFRAKIDVSRSETIKSAYLVQYDRPLVADVAADWVNEGRRSANIQFFGDWQKKIHYQLAVGDGVSSDAFIDAHREESASLRSQSRPMLGGKLRLSPISGWEEKKRTETYFGEGKHLSAGIGYFFQDNIEFDTASDFATVDRRLTNIEMSAHYGPAFIQAEYFLLDGAIEDFSAATLNTGDADGWYVLSEYVFPELSYIAPFARYDYYDSFTDGTGYDREDVSGGVNWYLRGNTMKVGVQYVRSDFGSAFSEDSQNTFRITSQLFF